MRHSSSVTVVPTSRPDSVLKHFSHNKLSRMLENSSIMSNYYEVPEQLRTDLVQVFWRQLNLKVKGKWKPPVREGAGMIGIPDRGAYLFGGLSHNLLSDLNFLQCSSIFDGSVSSKSKQSSEKSPRPKQEWNWSTVQTRNFSLNSMDRKDNLIPIQPTSRCGHSMALLERDRIVVYGGQQLFKQKINRRGCLSDVLVFDTVGNNWYGVQYKGSIVPARRNHLGVIWDKFLFVFGGFDSSGSILSDSAMLDLGSSKEWRYIPILNPHKGPGGLAFSAAAVVDPPFSLQDHILSISSLQKHEQLEQRGIYIFGGLLKDGTASNKLYLLRKAQSLGRSSRVIPFTPSEQNQDRNFNYEWQQPFTIGKPPPPRFGHSMTLLKPVLSSKAYLVVYGGRNDTREQQGIASKTAQGGVRCMDDLWMLDLTPLIIRSQDSVHSDRPDYLFLRALKEVTPFGERVRTPPVWTRVVCQGRIPSARHSHCMAEFEGKLLLFGGIGEKEYSAADIHILQTDPGVVKRLKEIYSKHHAASLGVMNSGGIEYRVTTENNEMVSDWLDSNESLEKEDPTQFQRDKLLKKMSKNQFLEIQRQMFQKSLQQLVNNAFFQNQKNQKSSIVKSMLIKNKLRDHREPEKSERRELSVTFASHLGQKSVNRSSVKECKLPSIPDKSVLLKESLKRRIPSLPIQRSSTLIAENLEFMTKSSKKLSAKTSSLSIERGSFASHYRLGAHEL